MSSLGMNTRLVSEVVILPSLDNINNLRDAKDTIFNQYGFCHGFCHVFYRHAAYLFTIIIILFICYLFIIVIFILYYLYYLLLLGEALSDEKRLFVCTGIGSSNYY